MCLSYTWAHIKYPSSLFVCMRSYKHTPTHHPNNRKNGEIYQTNPLSLPLPKLNLPPQQHAPTMNKLGKPPFPIPSDTLMQMFKNTCDTLACSREIREYKQIKCAYMSAYVQPVLSMVTSIYRSNNNTGPRVFTLHIQHLSGAVFHAPHSLYIRMHASTPGTIAWQ